MFFNLLSVLLLQNNSHIAFISNCCFLLIWIILIQARLSYLYYWWICMYVCGSLLYEAVFKKNMSTSGDTHQSQIAFDIVQIFSLFCNKFCSSRWHFFLLWDDVHIWAVHQSNSHRLCDLFDLSCSECDYFNDRCFPNDIKHI